MINALFFCNEESRTVQKALYSLIELQEVDKRLDELKEERGDLPLIVEELQSKLNNKNDALKQSKNDLKKAKIRQRDLELLIEEAKEKLAKYEEQLYQVKTNKEYDAITTETDAVKESIDQNEDELLRLDDTITSFEKDISELDSEVFKHNEELEENKVELQATLNATAEEENLLNQERDIIIQQSSPEIIKSYEMVREARNGQGIAPISGNSCGGCFSFIPPQKVVEIRKMKKIYTCEYCGRILVWDETNS